MIKFSAAYAVNPPLLLGPVSLGGIVASKAALASYSSFGLFYLQVLQDEGANGVLVHPQNPGPLVIDVRDAARAHVLALTAPLSTEPSIGRKRILVAGPHFMWRDAVEHLAVSHPALAAQGRLKDIGFSKSAKELKMMSFDTDRAEAVLGLKEFVPWEKTVDDMVDSILRIESTLEKY